jgi:hypothetical protein
MSLKNIAKHLLCLTFSIYFFSAWGCASRNIIMEKPAEPLLSARAIIEKIAHTDLQKDTMKAIANIEIKTAKRKYPVKAAVVIKRPLFLRLEVIPIIGPPRFFLSINGETMKVFIPDKRKFYITTTKSDYFASLAPLPLQPEALLSLMMGSYPQIPEGDSTLKEVKEDDLICIDMLSKGHKMQSLFIEPQTYRLVRVCIYNDADNLLYSAHFDDYQEVNNIPVPQKVNLLLHESNSSITIRYSDIQLSIEKDTAQFDIPIPAGIEPNHMN